MKEFDFDELDRAVNSLMADVKTTEPTPTSPVPEISSSSSSVPPVSPAASSPSIPEPTPVTPAIAAPVSKPSVPAAAPVSSPSTPASPVAPRSAPRLAPQRNGRFMDVVHPSSDMKSTPLPTPSSTPSREGASLQPLTSSTPPVVPAAPVSSASNDPSPKETRQSDVSTPEPTDEANAPLPVSEPWSSSPFLPDTQVEKRPLGGATPSEPVADTGLSEAIAAELSKEHPSEQTPPTSTETNAKPQDEPSLAEPVISNDTVEESVTPTDDVDIPPKDDPQLQASPQKEVVAMPAELDTNLVAIESGQADMSSPSPSVSHSSSPTASLSTHSIPQQYDEQPTSGDTSHTPIYDNEAVHQPLAHPVKKKSGWMLVVFIVAILIIGGALGAGAYFLGLI